MVTATPLKRAPGSQARPVQVLQPGTVVVLVAGVEASSDGLVKVLVGDESRSERQQGWVQRGHLRLSGGRSASAHKLAGSGFGNVNWVRPFVFAQLADSQLGMQETFDAQPSGWATEETLLRRAVAEINRLRPAFAIVCGDLINEYPAEDGSENLKRTQQTFDYKHVMRGVHPSIPLVCVCGNHDVGNRPTAASVAAYDGGRFLTLWLLAAEVRAHVAGTRANSATTASRSGWTASSASS